MIPKVLHYCWFGKNPKPQLVIDCIATWKKYFPGWEIKEWNESNYDFKKKFLQANVNLTPIVHSYFTSDV